jgi:general secretion pathway protein G
MLRMIRKTRSGFTLIEILIVVIILGILAAIVIPQFSSASNDARKSNVQSTVQTLRTQVTLYKLEHQDKLPDIITDWSPLILKTDQAGAFSPAAGVQTYGPYMQDTPVNALNTRSTVLQGVYPGPASAACGFIYDYGGGTGSGKVWATDTDATTLLP